MSGNQPTPLEVVAIAQAAGLHEGPARGGEHYFACPRHEDAHPSLAANPDKNHWYCRVCKHGGRSGWSLAAWCAGVNPDDKPRVKEWLVRYGLLATQLEARKFLYQMADSAVAFVVCRQGDGTNKLVWQTAPDGTKGLPTPWKSEASRPCYHLPGLVGLADAATVVVVEGEPHVDRLWELNIPATTASQGAGNDRFTDWAPLTRFASVVLMPDADDPGHAHMRGIAQRLVAAGMNSSHIHWLALPDLPPKGDVLDWLAQGGTPTALAELIATAPEWSPEPNEPTVEPASTEAVPSRAEIPVNGRFLRELVADATEVLVATNDPPQLFRRGTILVYWRSDLQGLEVARQPWLMGHLDQMADFVKVDDKGGVRPARPPMDMVTQLLTQPPERLPVIQGVRQAPVVVAPGRVVRTPGFDALSGWWVQRDGTDAECRLTVEEAKTLLFDECWHDFPFANRASRAHAVAALLQGLVRPLIQGPTPLYLVEAPTPGTGKGLLVDTIARILLGQDAPKLQFEREEETEKRITAALLADRPMVVWDNVTALRSPALAAVLTATTWEGRLLGRSELIQTPNTALWIAAGNNVALSDELARRVVPIRLDATEARPEHRTGFRYPHLLAWVLERRSELLAAALALVTAWLDAGQPAGTASRGSFESWAAVIGGILDAVKIPDFLAITAQAESDDQNDWVALADVWAEQFGSRPITAKFILGLARRHELCLDVWAGGSNTLSEQQRFGRALQAQRDRVWGQWILRQAGRDAKTRSVAYRLEARTTAIQTPQTPETPRSVMNQAVGHEPTSGVRGVSGVYSPTDSSADGVPAQEGNRWETI